MPSPYARDIIIREVLRVVDKEMTWTPTAREISIVQAITSMLRDQPPRVIGNRVDYLSMVQARSREAWVAEFGDGISDEPIPEKPRLASAGIETPIGLFRAVTRRKAWKSGRPTWATEYYLDDVPMTIADIKAAGLAQRQTTRNRQRRI